MHDLVVIGARVLDGRGRPAFGADVAVDGDTIVAVGRLESSAARRTIRADGLIAPGWCIPGDVSGLHS